MKPAGHRFPLPVSRETQERLEAFVALFLKWAGTINLVAPSTLDDVWDRHVLDSAQIYRLFEGPKTWIDLGSGGGFPGIVTGIFLAEIGDGWIHLVESNQKKAAFLRTAILSTGARATVHTVRAEDAPHLIGRCDALSARALAELKDLLTYGFPWAEKNPHLRFYFHKGRDYRAEVENARSRWSFDLIEHKSCVASDSVILELSNLSRNAT